MQMIRLVVVFPLRCGCTVNPLTIAVIFGQLTGPGEPGLPVRMVWILLLLCSVAFAYTPEEPLLFDSFPDDFLWGSATAAYQVILTSSETIRYKCNSIRLRAPGTRMEKGRAFGTFSPRYLITPLFTAKVPGNVIDGSSGDVACDSYHNYKEDVRLMKEMGLTSYRSEFVSF